MPQPPNPYTVVHYAATGRFPLFRRPLLAHPALRMIHLPTQSSPYSPAIQSVKWSLASAHTDLCVHGMGPTPSITFFFTSPPRPLDHADVSEPLAIMQKWTRSRAKRGCNIRLTKPRLGFCVPAELWKFWRECAVITSRMRVGGTMLAKLPNHRQIRPQKTCAGATPID